MQKIVNVVALTSGVVSLAVVGSGLFVFVNRDSIIDNVKQQAIEAALGSLGGLGGALPTGANDLPSVGATPSMAPAAPAAPMDQISEL
tara:strand:- start:1526 stop:1789 length:264 start_codon:yes stop_codon:yes gene_type:complete